MNDIAVSKKKNIIIIASAIVTVVLIAIIAYALTIRAQRNTTIEQIKQIPTKTFIDFEREEAAKRGYSTLPVPDVSAPESVISATVDQLVKNEIEKLYSTAALEERMKSDVAKVRLIERAGIPVAFTLKSGEKVEGRFKSKKADRKEKYIVTVGNKSYKLKSEIMPEFHALFDKAALNKLHMEIKKQSRKSFYEQKTINTPSIKQAFQNEHMKRAHYAYEGTSWVPVKDKIMQNAKMRYDGFLVNYKKQVDEVLDNHRFLGHRFKLEELELETPLTPKN